MTDANEVVVVTAVFLADGNPAYLTGGGTWSRAFAEAAMFSPEQGQNEAQARAQSDQRIVCDPYSFKVAVDGGSPKALSTREQVRAAGKPTVRMRRPDR